MRLSNGGDISSVQEVASGIIPYILVPIEPRRVMPATGGKIASQKGVERLETVRKREVEAKCQRPQDIRTGAT